MYYVVVTINRAHLRKGHKLAVEGALFMLLPWELAFLYLYVQP
jgi:hypothetical protein